MPRCTVSPPRPSQSSLCLSLSLSLLSFCPSVHLCLAGSLGHLWETPEKPVPSSKIPSPSLVTLGSPVCFLILGLILCNVEALSVATRSRARPRRLEINLLDCLSLCRLVVWPPGQGMNCPLSTPESFPGCRGSPGRPARPSSHCWSE